MLYDCMSDYLSEGTPPPTDEILVVFEEIVSIVEKCQQQQQDDEAFLIRQKKAYNSSLTMVLEILFLISHLKLSYDKDTAFTKTMNKLQLMNPQNLFKQTLLHLSYTMPVRQTKAAKLQGARQNWHPYLTKIMLQNGSDVNARDVFRDTPLQTFLKHNGVSVTTRGIISTLLQYDAHIDAYNVHGETAVSSMREMGHDVCEVKYTSLKCLTARIICKNDIMIPGYVPGYLMDFIQLHDNIKESRE